MNSFNTRPDGTNPNNDSVPEYLAHDSARKPPVHKRTYANTRSYLAPVALLPSELKIENEQVGGDNTRESYADLTVRWGLDVEVYL